MKSIRCGHCRKLLFKNSLKAHSGQLEIKCSRCGEFNTLRPKEPERKQPQGKHGYSHTC
ncbi:Com family DNA-binding transcriptional regulator [Pseudovibrio ascidiaceicola]|uniref:Com family DNA-binding transcriptional regulator n=1 Tax=Pseudovibrio ascidiaceicola TaxID=285279 RepID=UPI003D35B5D3